MSTVLWREGRGELLLLMAGDELDDDAEAKRLETKVKGEEG